MMHEVSCECVCVLKWRMVGEIGNSRSIYKNKPTDSGNVHGLCEQMGYFWWEFTNVMETNLDFEKKSIKLKFYGKFQ